MLEKITHSAVAAAVVCATTAYFPAHADTKDAWTVSTAVQLAEDVTVTGVLTLDGGSIDLNGHVLTVKNVTGSGVIVDATNDKFALYRKLQYLESTTAGKQFIDTGYIHNPRSNVRVKFSHPSYPTAYTWFSYFGGGGRDRTHSFGGWICYTGGRYYHWKSLGSGEGTWNNSSAGTVYNLFIRKSSQSGDNGNCYVANEANDSLVCGAVTANAADWPDGTTSVTAYLFGHHNPNGTLNSDYVGSRIYLCEIREGGTDASNLVRSFIPVQRRVDGKPGMQDTVNDVFYPNANPESAEDFTPGPEVADALSATAAEIAAAGKLVIDIDEGETVNLSSLRLYGKVRLVKTGKGTLVQDAAAEYVCGTDVQDGTFQTTASLVESVKADVSIGADAVVSLACAGDVATASLPATLTFKAGGKLRFDMSAFSGSMFSLATGGISLGAGVATVSGCLETTDPASAKAMPGAGNTVRVVAASAPVTAYWTGAAGSDAFSDAGNWRCVNFSGGVLPATTLPGAQTTLYVLEADADWSADGEMSLADGAALDLAGHSLTVAGMSGGAILDSSCPSSGIYRGEDGEVYVEAQWLHSTTAGKQFIDTGYCHNPQTVVDLKVEYNPSLNGNGKDWGATTPVTAYIFGHHNLNGTLYDDPYVGVRVYYCKISEGATVVRDFVPAKRISDGKPGMYDKGNGRFYVNGNRASSSDFNIGPLAYSAQGEGGELRIAVAENAAVSLDGLSRIAGAVKVVKSGTGTLSAPVSGQYFIGGLDVREGVLALAGTVEYAGGAIAVAAGVEATLPASFGSNANTVSLSGGSLTIGGATAEITGTATLSGGSAVAVSGTFRPTGTSNYATALLPGAAVDFTVFAGGEDAPPLAGVSFAASDTPYTVTLALDAPTCRRWAKEGRYLFTWNGAPQNVAFALDAASNATFRLLSDESGLKLRMTPGTMIVVR